MRFLRQVYLNAPSDCDWLRSGHLKNLNVPSFKSFVLHGNEDSPAKVELFASQKPEYNEYPVVTLTQNDEGDLALPYTGTAKLIRRRK